MRHQKAGRKLGRTSSHRRALLRNLVTSLLMHERIITTEAKAKELRRIAEQMITLGKREDLHARRQASRTIMDETVLKKLFETLGARFSKRAGGYTRITKLSYRAGDGAPLAAIELLDQEDKEKEKKETPSAKIKKVLQRKDTKGKKEGAPKKGEDKKKEDRPGSTEKIPAGKRQKREGQRPQKGDTSAMKAGSIPT